MSEKKKGKSRSMFGGTDGRLVDAYGSGYPGQIGEQYVKEMKGQGYTGPMEPRCSHEGTEPVFVLKDTDIGIYAASKAWAREASFLVDFVIDCGAHVNTGSSTPFVKATGTLGPGDREKITGLNDLIMNVPPIAQLDWPDQGIPAGGAAFWLGLINILPDPGKVLVCCIGGHGRTGTCMASLLIATQPGITAKQAIDFVRARHCKHAIETLAQERYLCALAEQMRRLGARAQQLVLERAQVEAEVRKGQQGKGEEPRIDEVPPPLDGVIVVGGGGKKG